MCDTPRWRRCVLARSLHAGTSTIIAATGISPGRRVPHLLRTAQAHAGYGGVTALAVDQKPAVVGADGRASGPTG